MDDTQQIITDQPVVNMVISTDNPINIAEDKNEAKTENVDNSVDNIHTHVWTVNGDNALSCACGEKVQTVNTIAKPQSNAGRPCEYCEHKERYQKIAEDYIASFETAEKPSTPFIEELALKLKKHRETILNWRNKMTNENVPEHPEFIDTIKRVESFQRLALLKRTLGRFNPTGAIFQLKTNHGFMEADKHIMAGDKNEPLQITIVEEDRHVADN